jgi:hypothetical protein
MNKPHKLAILGKIASGLNIKRSFSLNTALSLKTALSLTALISALPLLLTPGLSYGDGLAVDKVYLPYVEALEHELEYRVIATQDNDPSLDKQAIHKLGYGQTLLENWFFEAYLIGDKQEDESLDLAAYELEARWQVTEQGEYASDLGMVFELEKDADDSIWEVASTLILAFNRGRYTTTVNATLGYEWGDSIDNEFETGASLQSKYRLQPSFEPAIEIYTNEDTLALGPVIMGTIKTGIMQQVYWEFGALAGLQKETPDMNLRFLLEYEF